KLVPTLTIYLLLVSVGMPLHKVYCACQGAEFISFWKFEHECQLAHHHSEEEEHHTTSCCAAHEESSHCADQFADEDHDCGTSEMLLFQLDLDFTQQLADVVVENHGHFVFPTAFTALRERHLLYIPKAIPIRGPTPPPPILTGRDLLVRHQAFLC
ncbi:MAG: hypothetical protein AAFQ37_14760, partial [Bacteroidota bacterium]